MLNNLRQIFLLLCMLFSIGCVEKGIVEDNPQESFANAKEPYDEHNYELAMKKLNEFKSRFPYSRYAAEAELLIANSHFETGKFAEAGVAYEQFAKLHPKHPQMDFVLFRIGMSYWKDAPPEIDREQEYTQIAMNKWDRLVKDFPSSSLAGEAKQLMQEGRQRIAKAEDFIARYYCRKEVWHSCAYHSLIILERFADQKDLAREAVKRASEALRNLADNYDENKKDKNLFNRDASKEELEKKSRDLEHRLKD